MFRLRVVLVLIPILLSACSGDDGGSSYECVLLQANQEEHRLRDFQYARNRVFDLGVIGDTDYIDPGDSLIMLSVYQSAGSLDPNSAQAVAYPNALDPGSSPDSVVQRFRQLDFGSSWEILINVDTGQFTLIFPSPLQNIQTTTIAYFMQVKKANGSLLTFGSRDGEIFRLQILKFAHPRPSDPLWRAEWKNVYDLGRDQLSWHSLQVVIYKARFGEERDDYSQSFQNGLAYLHLLGLDRDSPFGGDTGGDGRVDNNRSVLWLDKGLLIFPSPRPFDDPVLEVKVPEIYSTTDLGSLVESSNYYLSIRTSGFMRRVRLSHINLIENSERVEVSGILQTRGVHYNIDYITGEIEFLSDDIVNSGGPIQICYEYE